MHTLSSLCGTRTIALCLSLALLASCSDSGTDPETINLTGSWSGTLTQPNGPIAAAGYQVDFVQDGAGVTGTSRSWVLESPEFFVVRTLSGTFDGRLLSFQDTEITDERLPPEFSAFCVKTLVELVLSGNSLSGEWAAPGCAPGTILITRD